MKRLCVLMGSTLTALMLVSVFSNGVSAKEVELQGTSPSFPPNTAWSIWVGYLNAGDILTWVWSSSDRLGFAVFTSPDLTWHYGLSSNDRLLVEEPGYYNLWWYNGNSASNATVTYSILAFTPQLAIETPVQGEYLPSDSISVQGA